MNDYIVSARKYRPTSFNDVLAQSHITTTLKNAIKNNQLAQAFLFCGPRGVGKTTCARILAKSINCQNSSQDAEPCNTCNSCISFNNNASFNIHELDAASNNSVEDIRSLVEQVRYAPQAGKYKIYIIDEVHMLSNAAFNAFLKTLEEPPSYAIFILATTEKHKILPTILSRCQIFDFNRIQPNDISTQIRNIANTEGIEYEEEAVELISEKADGAMRDALSMFDLIVTFGAGKKLSYKATIDNLHILDYEYYFKILEALNKNDVSSLFLVLDDIIKKGFDEYNFITGLSDHIRTLLICKFPNLSDIVSVSKKLSKRYESQSGSLNRQYLIDILNVSNKCQLEYKNSKNKRLHVELALVNMTKFQLTKSSECETYIPGENLTSPKNSVASINKEKTETIKNTPPKEAKSAELNLNISRNLVIDKPTENRTNTNIISEQTTKNDDKVDKTRNTFSEKAIASKYDKEENNDVVKKNLDNPIREDLKVKKESLKREISSTDTLKRANYESTTKILTLEQIKARIQKKTKADEKDYKKEEPVLIEEARITTKEEKLQTWNKFLKKLQQEGRHTEYSLLNQKPDILENTLKIKIESGVKEDIFNNIKQELLECLRNEFSNQKFNIETEIIESKKMYIPYTNREKFEYMAKKNSNLAIFKEKLGLDLDI